MFPQIDIKITVSPLAERHLVSFEAKLRSVTLALGIAFHELATNAVKYGAFSNEAGSILLAWTIEPRPEGDRLILCWQEKDGPPVTPPTRKGFGSRVIERGLPHELQGTVTLDYRGDGMVSLPKIRSIWDSQREAESSHHQARCLRSCTCS
jgi:two-component sensor histidine kinase